MPSAVHLARYEGLPEVASGRVGDARFVLAGLTGVYATACWLALAPGWLTDGHGAIAVVAVIATAATAVLFRARRLA